MITPSINHDIVYKIISNLNENEIIFGGSISDYFLYEKHNVNINFKIKDVDVIIFNTDTLAKLEDIFEFKSVYKGLIKTNVFRDYNQYHIYLKGSMIDIFMYDNDFFNTEIAEYYEYKVRYYSMEDRIDILKKAIQHEFGMMQFNNYRQFKHIKKLMVYNEIING